MQNQLRSILKSSFVAGFCLGAFLALWVYDVANRRDLVGSISDSSNLVIAGCSIFLAFVAGLSFLASQRASVWAANKDALLELLRCLQVSIGEYEKCIALCDYERDLQNFQWHGDEFPEEKPSFVEDPDHVNNLNKALFEIESVFSPILPDRLTGVIRVFREREAKIDEGYRDDALDTCEAYEMQLEASVEFQKELREFIADFSGVKHL